jgi:hypothetical protein
MVETFLSHLQTVAIYEFQLLNCSLETWREREREETKASKCISICKVPYLFLDGRKRLESPKIVLLETAFYYF